MSIRSFFLLSSLVNGLLQYTQTVRVNVFFNVSILTAVSGSTSGSRSDHSSSYSPILFLFS